MARLGHLAPMKATAQVAAAIGREFALDLLETIAPLSPEQLRGAIDRLVASGLLFRQNHRAEEVYAFKHALVQDAAYASMLRDERRRLHILIAEALCTKFGTIAEHAPELVAHHYTEAREFELAVAYWLKAGRQASARSAFTEATTHFESALDHLAQLPESAERDMQELASSTGVDERSRRGQGLWRGGNRAGVRPRPAALQQDPEHAANPCRAQRPGRRALRAGRFRPVAPRRRGSAGARCVPDRHDIRPDGASRARHVAVRDRRARPGATAFGARLGLYKAPRHGPMALVFSHDFKATAEVYLGLVRVLRGDIDGGLGHARDALAYAEGLRHPHTLCYVLPFVAGAYLIAGSAEEAFPVADRAVALSTEYGFPEWGAGGTFLRGWARVELGEIERGIADIRLGMEGSEATGNLAWLQYARFLLALALAKADRRGEATDLADRVLVEIGAATGRWFEAEVHRLKGDLLWAAGRPVAEVEAGYEDSARGRGATGRAPVRAARRGRARRAVAGARSLMAGTPPTIMAPSMDPIEIDEALGERYFRDSIAEEERHTDEIIEVIRRSIETQFRKAPAERAGTPTPSTMAASRRCSASIRTSRRSCGRVSSFPGASTSAWIRFSNGNIVQRLAAITRRARHGHQADGRAGDEAHGGRKIHAGFHPDQPSAVLRRRPRAL